MLTLTERLDDTPDDGLDILYPGLCYICASKVSALCTNAGDLGAALGETLGSVLICTHELEKRFGPVSDDPSENPVVAWHRENFPDVDLVQLNDDEP